MAMLKQLAPNVVIPPSPKKIAWIEQRDRDRDDRGPGPSTIATMPMPTAWPVVPPGRGRLNIMMTKEKAENTRQQRHHARVQQALHPLAAPRTRTARPPHRPRRRSTG